MTSNKTDKILVYLEKRFGASYLKNRLMTENCHSMLRQLASKVIYRKDMDPAYIFLKFILVVAGSYFKLRANTIKYEVKYHTTAFNNLPAEFDGFKILHLSDIHMEGIPDNGRTLSKKIAELKYDLCVITGDYRFLSFGDYTSAIEKLKTVTDAINPSYGTIGVMGNHDCIRMLPELETLGIRVLVNESEKIKKGNDSIWIGGVDNPSFHTCASLSKTLRLIPENSFSVLLAHSPGLLRESRRRGIDFYLCGHTHGGQLCLPNKKPIITKAKCERKYAVGPWDYKGMKGYTSRGTGTSGLPIRLYCPPEIIIHTLKKGGYNALDSNSVKQ